MKRMLTPKERERLLQCHRRERDRRICDRIKAVLAYDDGYSYSEIARILLLDDETIRRHIDDYRDENKLKSESGGSDSKLDNKETRELLGHLRDVTYIHVKDICQYVFETYRKRYSVSGMTKWLHERKEIATTAHQKRLNFIGGISLNGHRFTYHQADKVDAISICDFLWKLRQSNPGKYYIHVIWDNARPHKNDEVYAFAKELGIKLHYLPPYSPNLNPAERVWKLMHESVRYNKYYGKFSEFSEATLDFFKSIGRKKSILRERITDNFQILHSPMFAF